jgi:hypothetical protein
MGLWSMSCMSAETRSDLMRLSSFFSVNFDLIVFPYCIDAALFVSCITETRSFLCFLAVRVW